VSGSGLEGLFVAPTPEAAVRALWYTFSCWAPPNEKQQKKKGKEDTSKPFDPYSENKETIFDVDVRDLRNGNWNGDI
jgi:hypothetical protein